MHDASMNPTEEKAIIIRRNVYGYKLGDDQNGRALIININL